MGRRRGRRPTFDPTPAGRPGVAAGVICPWDYRRVHADAPPPPSSSAFFHPQLTHKQSISSLAFSSGFFYLSKQTNLYCHHFHTAWSKLLSGSNPACDLPPQQTAVIQFSADMVSRLSAVFHVSASGPPVVLLTNSGLQSQKAVTAYFSSKQLSPLGFARQSSGPPHLSCSHHSHRFLPRRSPEKNYTNHYYLHSFSAFKINQLCESYMNCMKVDECIPDNKMSITAN